MAKKRTTARAVVTLTLQQVLQLPSPPHLDLQHSHLQLHHRLQLHLQQRHLHLDLQLSHLQLHHHLQLDLHQRHQAQRNQPVLRLLMRRAGRPQPPLRLGHQLPLRPLRRR